MSKHELTPSTVLVIGPTRSGKSRWAEQLAVASHLEVVYIATARDDPTDSEWSQRLAQHRQRRPSQWQTCEVPVELAAAIQRYSALPHHDQPCILIDSLGTWVANTLDCSDTHWQCLVQALVNSLLQRQQLTILVGEETGWGVVPAYAQGRLFRDRLGALIMTIGSVSTTTWLVAGGHAINMTQLGVKLIPDR
jgi:adenosylcobinamide kinase/adenosylcobinamide-phosphate guanylyltransferase